MNIWKYIRLISILFLSIFYQGTYADSEQYKADLFPVLGIVSLNYRETTLSYVNGVNVKFAEMAGAQVIPIYALGET